MNLNISGVASAYVNSGNYGGSTQYEVFPSEYHYSYFDANDPKNSAQKEVFCKLITDYLESITVNNSVTLGEYLTYLYQNDTDKLREIHSSFHERKAVGNIHQSLATLFFVDDKAGTVLRLDPYQTALSWDKTTTSLNEFLQENAQHFKGQIPDAFYMKYYGN
jgi:hypothetical protein